MRLLAQVFKGVPLAGMGQVSWGSSTIPTVSMRVASSSTLWPLLLGGNHLALGNERTAGG